MPWFVPRRLRISYWHSAGSRFSRVRILDLNAIVSGMEDLLRRLIGENIQLVTVLGGNLGKVKADPGQVEQVILNLAVNARDAMPAAEG